MLDDETYKYAATLPVEERIKFLNSEIEFDEYANPSPERVRSVQEEALKARSEKPNLRAAEPKRRFSTGRLLLAIALLTIATVGALASLAR